MPNDTVNITIDEGTVHLIMAAYRIGRNDPHAAVPHDLGIRCLRLIQADTPEAQMAAVSGEEA